MTMPSVTFQAPTIAYEVPSRRHRAWAAAWLLALVAGLAADAIYLSSAPAISGETDFHQFRDSVRAWMAGEPMYEPVPQGDRVVYNLNPPHFHLLVLPLAGLTAGAGFAVWLGVGIAALAWVLWRILPVWFSTLREPLWPLLLLGWIFATPITGSVLVTGAPVWILLPALYLAWQAHRVGRFGTAGALVGVLASFKLFLLILLPWFLLRGERRIVRASILAFVASFALGLMVFGVEAYAGWIAALRVSGGWAWGQLNASLAALTTRAFTPTPYWKPVSTDIPALAIWVFLTLALLLAAAARIRTIHLDTGWAVVLVTALLVGPLGWIYYLWWLLPLVLMSGVGSIAFVGAALFTLPPWVIFSGQPSTIATVTVGSVYVWGTLALWCSLLFGQPADYPTSHSAAMVSDRPR